MTEKEELSNIDYGLIAWNLHILMNDILRLYNECEVKMTNQQAMELHEFLNRLDDYAGRVLDVAKNE